jgi:hypothetical protein
LKRQTSVNYRTSSGFLHFTTCCACRFFNSAYRLFTYHAVNNFFMLQRLRSFGSFLG